MRNKPTTPIILGVVWAALVAMLLVILAAGPAQGQVTVTGPTEPVRINERVLFDITGLDAAGYADSKLWIRPPDGVTAEPFTAVVDGRLVLLVQADTPGVYWFVLAVPGADGKGIDGAEFELTVGEPEPAPPDVDPLPLGDKFQVVIVHESKHDDNLPADQQSLLSSLAFRERLIAAGHKMPAGGVIDRDAVTGVGKMPVDLASFLGACQGKKLPRLCLSPLEGGKIRTFDLPADEAGVFALLEGGG